MTLKELDELIKKSGKKKSYATKNEYDVSVTINKSRGRERIRLCIENEPGSCNFAGTTYWVCAFDKTTNRLYVVYSTRDNGYKVIKGGHIGFISFTDDELLRFIKRNDIGKFFKWRWDYDCGRAYIQLMPKEN